MFVDPFTQIGNHKILLFQNLSNISHLFLKEDTDTYIKKPQICGIINTNLFDLICVEFHNF